MTSAVWEVRAAVPFETEAFETKTFEEAKPPRTSESETYRWDERRQRPVAVDSPPPPQQVVHQTHYVPYEQDRFAAAHQWASEQVARKFPGSVEMLSTLESLIKQQMNGE